MRLLGAVLVAGLCAIASATASASPVEIVLIDRLDDARGFCFDILGFKHKADPSRGLQAHTCYSYQGEIAVDQAFARDKLRKGQLNMPAFDVCVTLIRARPGEGLGLKPCDASAEQRFELTPTGAIVAKSAPQLCVTVSGDASRPGGGGNPPHLIRRLSVEDCDPGRERYQRWRVRDTAD